jgi:hypothetical protein
MPQTQAVKMGKKKNDEVAKLEGELQAKHDAELAACDACEGEGGEEGGGEAADSAPEPDTASASEGIEKLNLDSEEMQACYIIDNIPS